MRTNLVSRVIQRTNNLYNQGGIIKIIKHTNKYIKNQAYWVSDYFGMADNISNLNNLQRNNKLDFLLKTVYEDFDNVLRITQIKSEIRRLLTILQNDPPKVMLEIGTAYGGTLFLFSKICRPDSKIISIDLPYSIFAGGYPSSRKILYNSFATTEMQKIHLIKADSHDSKTLTKLKQKLDGNKLDFLFIDGDHSYEGVKKDFELYHNLIRKGGIIALHDIVKSPMFDSYKFWNEIKDNYVHEEIIDVQGNHKGAGIGVIYI